MLKRLFKKATDPRAGMAPLYAAIVAAARQPHWYVEGKVPDTLDGRFDMVAGLMSVVLIRLERENVAQQSVWLTETFVDDMDGQLRQMGIGDLVVGKHIGRMMSALGGRLTAYREALTQNGDLGDALVRNLYRGEAPDETALAHSAAAVRAFWDAINAESAENILAGDLKI